MMYTDLDSTGSCRRSNTTFLENVHQPPAMPNDVVKQPTVPPWNIPRPSPMVYSYHGEAHQLPTLIHDGHYQSCATRPGNNTNQHIIRPTARAGNYTVPPYYNHNHTARSAPQWSLSSENTATNPVTSSKRPHQFSSTDPRVHNRPTSVVDGSLNNFSRYPGGTGLPHHGNVPTYKEDALSQERSSKHHLSTNGMSSKKDSIYDCRVCSSSNCPHSQNQNSCKYPVPSQIPLNIPLQQTPGHWMSNSHVQSDTWALQGDSGQMRPIEGVDMTRNNPLAQKYWSQKKLEAKSGPPELAVFRKQEYQQTRYSDKEQQKVLDWCADARSGNVLQSYHADRFPDNGHSANANSRPTYSTLPLDPYTHTPHSKVLQHNYPNTESSHLHSRLTSHPSYPHSKIPKGNYLQSHVPPAHSNSYIPLPHDTLPSHLGMNNNSEMNGTQNATKIQYVSGMQSYGNPSLNSCNDMFENINYSQPMQVIDNSCLHINKSTLSYQHDYTYENMMQQDCNNMSGNMFYENKSISMKQMGYNSLYGNNMLDPSQMQNHMPSQFNMMSLSNPSGATLPQNVQMNHPHPRVASDAPTLIDDRPVKKRKHQGEDIVAAKGGAKAPIRDLRLYLTTWDENEDTDSNMPDMVALKKSDSMFVLDCTSLERNNGDPTCRKADEGVIQLYKVGLDVHNQETFASVIKPLSECHTSLESNRPTHKYHYKSIQEAPLSSLKDVTEKIGSRLYHNMSASLPAMEEINGTGVTTSGNVTNVGEGFLDPPGRVSAVPTNIVASTALIRDQHSAPTTPMEDTSVNNLPRLTPLTGDHVVSLASTSENLQEKANASMTASDTVLTPNDEENLVKKPENVENTTQNSKCVVDSSSYSPEQLTEHNITSHSDSTLEGLQETHAAVPASPNAVEEKNVDTKENDIQPSPVFHNSSVEDNQTLPIDGKDSNILSNTAQISNQLTENENTVIKYIASEVHVEDNENEEDSCGVVDMSCKALNAVDLNMTANQVDYSSETHSPQQQVTTLKMPLLELLPDIRSDAVSNRHFDKPIQIRGAISWKDNKTIDEESETGSVHLTETHSSTSESSGEPSYEETFYGAFEGETRSNHTTIDRERESEEIPIPMSVEESITTNLKEDSVRSPSYEEMFHDTFDGETRSNHTTIDREKESEEIPVPISVEESITTNLKKDSVSLESTTLDLSDEDSGAEPQAPLGDPPQSAELCLNDSRDSSDIIDVEKSFEESVDHCDVEALKCEDDECSGDGNCISCESCHMELVGSSGGVGSHEATLEGIRRGEENISDNKSIKTCEVDAQVDDDSLVGREDNNCAVSNKNEDVASAAIEKPASLKPVPDKELEDLESRKRETCEPKEYELLGFNETPSTTDITDNNMKQNEDDPLEMKNTKYPHTECEVIGPMFPGDTDKQVETDLMCSSNTEEESIGMVVEDSVSDSIALVKTSCEQDILTAKPNVTVEDIRHAEEYANANISCEQVTPNSFINASEMEIVESVEADVIAQNTEHGEDNEYTSEKSGALMTSSGGDVFLEEVSEEAQCDVAHAEDAMIQDKLNSNICETENLLCEVEEFHTGNTNNSEEDFNIEKTEQGHSNETIGIEERDVDFDRPVICQPRTPEEVIDFENMLSEESNKVNVAHDSIMPPEKSSDLHSEEENLVLKEPVKALGGRESLVQEQSHKSMDVMAGLDESSAGDDKEEEISIQEILKDKSIVSPSVEDSYDNSEMKKYSVQDKEFEDTGTPVVDNSRDCIETEKDLVQEGKEDKYEDDEEEEEYAKESMDFSGVEEEVIVQEEIDEKDIVASDVEDTNSIEMEKDLVGETEFYDKCILTPCTAESSDVNEVGQDLVEEEIENKCVENPNEPESNDFGNINDVAVQEDVLENIPESSEVVEMSDSDGLVNKEISCLLDSNDHCEVIENDLVVRELSWPVELSDKGNAEERDSIADELSTLVESSDEDEMEVEEEAESCIEKSSDKDDAEERDSIADELSTLAESSDEDEMEEEDSDPEEPSCLEESTHNCDEVESDSIAGEPSCLEESSDNVKVAVEEELFCVIESNDSDGTREKETVVEDMSCLIESNRNDDVVESNDSDDIQEKDTVAEDMSCLIESNDRNVGEVDDVGAEESSGLEESKDCIDLEEEYGDADVIVPHVESCFSSSVAQQDSVEEEVCEEVCEIPDIETSSLVEDFAQEEVCESNVDIETSAAVEPDKTRDLHRLMSALHSSEHSDAEDTASDEESIEIEELEVNSSHESNIVMDNASEEKETCLNLDISMPEVDAEESEMQEKLNEVDVVTTSVVQAKINQSMINSDIVTTTLSNLEESFNYKDNDETTVFHNVSNESRKTKSVDLSSGKDDDRDEISSTESCCVLATGKHSDSVLLSTADASVNAATTDLTPQKQFVVSPASSMISPDDSTEINAVSLPMDLEDEDMPSLEMNIPLSPNNPDSLEMPCLEVMTDLYEDANERNPADHTNDAAVPLPRDPSLTEEALNVCDVASVTSERERPETTFSNDSVHNWPYLEEEVFSETPRNGIRSPLIETTCSGHIRSPLPASESDSEMPSAQDLMLVPSSNSSSSFNDQLQTGKTRLKCRLSWDKIFNCSKPNGGKNRGIVNNRNELLKRWPCYVDRSYDTCPRDDVQSSVCDGSGDDSDGTIGLELGPAKIEVRLTQKPIPEQWQVVDSPSGVSLPSNLTSQEENNNIIGARRSSGNSITGKSPIVLVRRIILKRRADDMSTTCSNSSLSQLDCERDISCLTTPPESDDSSANLKTHTLPKVIIKRMRNGQDKYQSFLRVTAVDEKYLQPVVRLQRMKVLEDMARNSIMRTNLANLNSNKQVEARSPERPQEEESCDHSSFIDEPVIVDASGSQVLSHCKENIANININDQTVCEHSKETKLTFQLNQNSIESADTGIKGKVIKSRIVKHLVKPSETSKTHSGNIVCKISKHSLRRQSEGFQPGKTLQYRKRFGSEGSEFSRCGRKRVADQWKPRRQKVTRMLIISESELSGDDAKSKSMKSNSTEEVTVDAEEIPDTVIESCEACDFVYKNDTEKSQHVKTHPYYCQRCTIAFKSEIHFESHLSTSHPYSAEVHHCLLCKQCFSSSVEHQAHVASEQHRRLDLTQRWTIQTLFNMFTGLPCARIPPLTDAEVAEMNRRVEAEPGAINYYHQATPLQIAVQDLLSRGGHLSGIDTIACKRSRHCEEPDTPVE